MEYDEGGTTCIVSLYQTKMLTGLSTEPRCNIGGIAITRTLSTGFAGVGHLTCRDNRAKSSIDCESIE